MEGPPGGGGTGESLEQELRHVASKAGMEWGKEG